MSELWQYFKNLFKASENSSPNEPFIHEVIERSEEEKASYDRCKSKLARRRLTDWLNNEFIRYQANPKDNDEAIDFLNTPSSKGFVIHFRKTAYRTTEIIHLFDYLKEKVLQLDYKSYLSDSRTYNRANQVENIQRHYLKPPSNLGKKTIEKFDQKYGNITIELKQRNEKVHDLKFSATVYHDHKYQSAKPFTELMGNILGE